MLFHVLSIEQFQFQMLINFAILKSIKSSESEIRWAETNKFSIC